MFYVSKVTPFFFLLALFDLLISIIMKVSGQGYIEYGLLAVFGFIASTIIGAMYQIIPNSQQEKLSYPSLSYLTYLIFVLSSIFLTVGNYKSASLLFFIGVVLFSVHVATTVKNVKPITVRFLTASVFFLILSSVVFLSASFGDIPLQAAIHVFTVGTMINAVLGVEFAWIPMFYMQTVDFRKGNVLFFIAQAVTLFVTVSFFLLDYRILSLAVIFETFVIILFLNIIIPTIKAGKTMAGIPYVVKFFLSGNLFLLAGLIFAFLVTVTKNPHIIGFHIDFMVFGFGVFTIAGGMLHLTPRILWNTVYVKKAQEGKPVPQVGMVIDKKKAEMFFYSLLVSFVISIFLEFLNFIYGWILFVLVLLYFSSFFSYKLYKFYRD